MDHGDDIKAIGQAIKAMRERMALKQTDVAGRSGKSQSKVSQLENGEADPRLSTLIAVAKALNCEVAILPRQSVGTRSFWTDVIVGLGKRGPSIGEVLKRQVAPGPLRFLQIHAAGGEALSFGDQKSPGTRNAAFDDVFIPDPDQDDGEKG